MLIIFILEMETLWEVDERPKKERYVAYLNATGMNSYQN